MVQTPATRHEGHPHNLEDYQMTEKDRYFIEGRLRSAENVSFADADLAVHAFVDGKEVGAAPVDKTGAYKVAFEGGRVPPSVELRLVPARLSDKAAEFPGLVETVSPLRFAPAAHGAAHYATMDIYVSKQLVIDLHWATRTYRIHGTVYVCGIVWYGGLPTKNGLPAARLDFYEVSQARFWLTGNPPPPPRERYLGTAYTAQGGGYDFSFDFTTNILTALIFGDGKPDIKVRISQFRDGAWNQVYESMTDWDISEDFVKNYLIPLEDAYIPPGGKALPSGFRPIALGLLPLDTSRIVDGYATSGPGDPVTLSHQPLCETLRIFGLFGSSDNVAHYKVQMTQATKDSMTGNWIPAGEWEDVTDPLNNQQWNAVTKRWDWTVLGPDPVTHLYLNIDYEPEADWFEHALKVTWNSANKPDGYYLLKIVPYDVSGNQLPASLDYQLPVLCVDNSLPKFALAVTSPPPNECGGLTLPANPANRKIIFSVTAYSLAGHILWCVLEGHRGLNSDEAGDTTGTIPGGTLGEIPWGNHRIGEFNRTEATQGWIGTLNSSLTFNVDPNVNGCSAMAYNFKWWVQGSATNGYSSELTSRNRRAETNLVVSE
jgi:hypothetical protein